MLTPELLTVIIEGLDELETALGKKLTYAEKAEIISHTYVLYSDADPASDQTKLLIKDSIKEVYNLFSSLDGMIETEKGREQAIKIFTRIFGKALTEEKTKRAAQTLIGAKLSRLRLK